MQQGFQGLAALNGIVYPKMKCHHLLTLNDVIINAVIIYLPVCHFKPLFSVDILKNFGNQTVLVTINFHSMDIQRHFSKYLYLCSTEEQEVIQVENNTRVRK